MKPPTYPHLRALFAYHQYERPVEAVSNRDCLNLGKAGGG